jgi:DNA-binding NarL/FixJ family response regulator
MSAVDPTSAPVAGRARVLAVDDDASFLALLRDLVRETAHLEIAGEAQSGERAIVAARELQPDIVLMDVRMPGIGGMEAAKVIKAASSPTLIVMISAIHPDEIPLKPGDDFATTVLWKSTLASRALDEIWSQHRVRDSKMPIGDSG